MHDIKGILSPPTFVDTSTFFVWVPGSYVWHCLHYSPSHKKEPYIRMYEAQETQRYISGENKKFGSGFGIQQAASSVTSFLDKKFIAC